MAASSRKRERAPVPAEQSERKRLVAEISDVQRWWTNGVNDSQQSEKKHCTRERSLHSKFNVFYDMHKIRAFASSSLRLPVDIRTLELPATSKLWQSFNQVPGTNLSAPSGHRFPFLLLSHPDTNSSLVVQLRSAKVLSSPSPSCSCTPSSSCSCSPSDPPSLSTFDSTSPLLPLSSSSASSSSSSPRRQQDPSLLYIGQVYLQPSRAKLSVATAGPFIWVDEVIQTDIHILFTDKEIEGEVSVHFGSCKFRDLFCRYALQRDASLVPV